MSHTQQISLKKQLTISVPENEILLDGEFLNIAISQNRHRIAALVYYRENKSPGPRMSPRVLYLWNRDGRLLASTIEESLANSYFVSGNGLEFVEGSYNLLFLSEDSTWTTGHLRRWNTDSNHFEFVFQKELKPLYDIEETHLITRFISSCNGSYLALQTYQTRLYLFSPRSGELTFLGRVSAGLSDYTIMFSPDEKFLTGILWTDNTGIHINTDIHIWKTQNANLTLLKRTKDQGIEIFAISPDGQRLVTAGEWSAGTRICINEISPPSTSLGIITPPFGSNEGEFSVATFTPDGKYLITGHRNGAVCIWETDTYECMSKHEGAHSESIFYARVIQNQLFTADKNQIIVWSIERIVS